MEDKRTKRRTACLRILSVLVASLMIATTMYILSSVDSSSDVQKAIAESVINEDTSEEYGSIQDAIDDATAGDTLLIENGTYYEHVIVDKTLTIIGEDVNGVVVDGNSTGYVFSVMANYVNISDMTIRNGDTGVYVYGGTIYSDISDCIIANNTDGVKLSYDYDQRTDDNTISSNTVVNNSEYGIVVISNQNDLILDNTVTNNDVGIALFKLSHSPYPAWISIESNGVYDNNIGLLFACGAYNLIDMNTVQDNGVGIDIGLGYFNDNDIYYNNFIDNAVQTDFSNIDNDPNDWDYGYSHGGNYWSNYTGSDLYHGENQDIAGADGLYDVGFNICDDNRDNYPLVYPWPIDGTDPTITITNPSGNPSYTNQATVSLSGTYYDMIGVTSVNWSNDRGGSGSGSVSPRGHTWTCSGITVYTGSNNITVNGYDAAGNYGTDIVTVIADYTDPTVTITSPTSNPTYSNGDLESVSLAGSASDNWGISYVSWSNADSGLSGYATGTTSWTASDILLNIGSNLITVTVHDYAGNDATDNITVNRTAPTWDTIYIGSNAQFASQASTNGWPGDGSQSDPYIIYDYDIDASAANGIDIRYTNVYFVISNCDVTSTTHSYKGVYLSGVSYGGIVNTNIEDCSYGIHTSSCTDLDITGGSISSCSVHGTYLVCNDIAITGLNSSSNSGNGIYLLSCNGASVTDCIAISNGNNGIHLSGCAHVAVSGGVASSNSWRGIYVGGGNDTSISYTTVSSNSQDGIYLSSISSTSTKNVTIYGITASGNTRAGVYLASCKYVTISASDIVSNDATGSSYGGIHIWTGSSVIATITGNCIEDNYYGVCIKDTTDVNVHGNSFIENDIQGYDNNGAQNAWDDGDSVGNAWSDYGGSGWYYIDANSIDHYPSVA